MGGRVGYAWHRFLAYAKAGAAWERDNYELVLNTVAIALATETRGGWTAGVGVEYAFLDNWSVKVEYLFVDLGRPSSIPSRARVLPSVIANRTTLFAPV